MDRDGNVVSPLDVDAAMETMGELLEQDVESVAVSLLHAYKNPEHEQRLKAAIRERFPGVALSLSSEVAPVVNEYERTSTTVADCYVKPAVSGYLASLNGSLAEEGLPWPALGDALRGRRDRERRGGRAPRADAGIGTCGGRTGGQVLRRVAGPAGPGVPGHGRHDGQDVRHRRADGPRCPAG